MGSGENAHKEFVNYSGGAFVRDLTSNVASEENKIFVAKKVNLEESLSERKVSYQNALFDVKIYKNKLLPCRTKLRQDDLKVLPVPCLLAFAASASPLS